MTSARSSDWSVTRRVSFRFLFLYWTLYNIPQYGCASIFDILPWGAEKINAILCWPLQQPSLWLGKHLFHLQGIAASFHPTGSGDTALSYVLVLVILILSLLGTVLWSLLDRHRSNYRTLDAWLRLFISLVVATSMIEYGFAKIYPSQFGPIFLSRLNETYGESSPMALLWTFMGGSRWYTMFGGFAEATSGLLLFFRRTRTISALLAAGVLFNVVLLNFCYDVPVKIYSSHLFLMCLFLVAPDLIALARLFFLRRQIQLSDDHIPASSNLWIRRTGPILLALVVLSTLYTQGFRTFQPYSTDDTSIPLYGIWRVENATSTVAGTPWSEIIVDDASSMLIKRADSSFIRLKAKVDPAGHTIALTSKKFGNSLLHYAPDPANARHLIFDGRFNQGDVRFELKRRSPDSYLLLTRGFHWVNETSPNM